ncbi:MAG TPA: tRNA lysidine(34) synthetase TilS [Baekduia sp.]|nr:tRNA lysidine(34) synthetase TilS [Baekduia sp.]
MDVRDRVEATGLLPAGHPVVVLLSGGRDSACLLDLAVALAGAAEVTALHVDYGLRGAASAADARHCERLAARLGVPVVVERARRTAGAPGNVQAWARDVRYAAGVRLAASSSASLAVGHTLSDQVETILYRLAASPGRRALLGMEADTEVVGDAGAPVRLVRPLLAAEVTREETAAWCRSRGLAWRDDATNVDPAYARSRARAGLVPALRAVDPRAERNVVRTAQLLRDEAAVLDAVVRDALGGGDRLAVDELAALPPAVGRLVLRRLAEDATRRLCPRAAGRLDDVLALGEGALDLGDGARAIVERGVLRVGRTPVRPENR